MSKKIFFIRLLCITTIAVLALSSCAPATPAMGGIVQGAVYGDLNGNGNIDPGEVVLEGATVTLADCGPNQTQVTGADGLFNFTDLPAGTCHVSVSKTDWIYSGSYPALTYPVPVASDPALPTSFSLFMAPILTFTPTFTPTPPTSTPIPPGALDTLTPTVTSTGAAVTIPATPKVTPTADAANCRFGPGVAFSSVGGLGSGVLVPITATIADKSWWQIESPQNPGTFCWVSAAVTATFGDLSLVPIVPIPTGLVTAVSVVVNSGAVLHGTCGGPNATSFTVSITTNGPATVVYHISIYNSDDTLRSSPGDYTLVFANASTQTFDPGGAYKTDCGSFYIQAITTSPNSMTSQANWEVVSP